jgi:branched-chain amino acid transport system permease protein
MSLAMNPSTSKREIPYRGQRLRFLVVGFLLVIPLIIHDPYILGILVMANIYAAFGAGFDILLGYTGLAVIGYGLFVGVGAYSAAFLNLNLGLPPGVTLITGGLCGALFGLLLGIPCLRLRGIYLALASFAAAAICEKLVIVFHDFTYGFEGLSGLTPISTNRIMNYYVSLILMLVSVGLLLAIVKSKIGMILKSICDDETAAQAVGINTNLYKLFAFLVSSFLGGLWGSFLAHYLRHVGPDTFGLRIAITIIMVVIVGGKGTITGPVGGAYLLILLSEFLREIGEVRLLIYTIFTIVIMLLLPRGIVPSLIEFFTARVRRWVPVSKGAYKPVDKD